MDADDEALPHRLERQLTALEAQPQLVVLGTGSEAIDADGRVTGGGGSDDDPSAIRDGLLLANWIIHPTVMMRRGMVLAAGGYRPAFTACEDYDL